ncbi:hypothetical protein [Luteibacter sp. ME-Dv--P-043b]|uniref:hypothetical protein n=1 Tax=Luteibacter sp. ME-Dv--P-043b TaxID=3040291 RepID=UPI002553B633|nr:hypothetical protein [Luteibacter sp. ME-Dv--P-043b]
MSKRPDHPSPEPQLREDRTSAYNVAAATHPGACVVRVVDASGACVPRNNAAKVAPASRPSHPAKRT